MSPPAHPSRGLSTLLGLASIALWWFLWPLMLLLYLPWQLFKGNSFWFSRRGRIGRKHYWISLAFDCLYAFLTGAILWGFMDAAHASMWARWAGEAVLVAVPVALTATATAIRRLHDRNQPDWWILVFYFIPATLIGVGYLFTTAQALCILASFPLLAWAAVELGCRRGTPGPNRFGPRPVVPARLATPRTAPARAASVRTGSREQP